MNSEEEIELDHKGLSEVPEYVLEKVFLKKLSLYNNKLSSLPETFGKLTTLQTLWISYNQLKSLPESFKCLTALQKLYLNYNQLISLPVSLIRLCNLQSLYVSNNPIEYTSPVLLRFIEGLNRRHVNAVYNDAQSVHNSSIQKSVYDSLYRILNERPLENKVLSDFILNNKVLTEECKRALIEYSSDEEVHSLLKVSFKETLEVVLSIIILHRDKDEILKVLNQEMSDAMCMCFTGRITRLLNTLNGFDPRVSITISDNEQIAAIVEIARKKTNDVREQKELVTRDLRERGCSKEIIDEWTSFIEE